MGAAKDLADKVLGVGKDAAGSLSDIAYSVAAKGDDLMSSVSGGWFTKIYEFMKIFEIFIYLTHKFYEQAKSNCEIESKVYKFSTTTQIYRF